jgi:hypothetical protein
MEEKTEKEEIAHENAELAKKWISQIEISEKYYKDYWKKCESLIKTYTAQGDKTGDDLDEALYQVNIFWSNVQTLKPAIYANLPVIQAQRRFLDKDPTANTAALMLERATHYQTENYDFNSLIEKCVRDNLIIGRGTTWIRHDASLKQDRLQVSPIEGGKYISEEGDEYESDSVTEEDGKYYAVQEDITDDKVIADYVHFQDFLTSTARVWEEVRWVARKASYTKDAFKERFGEEMLKKVRFTAVEKEEKVYFEEDKKEQENIKKIFVYEIWCKDTKTIYWVTKSCKTQVLDQSSDFLGLKDFFPCPKPLFATLDNQSVKPIADFLFYQDQANQLNAVGYRIRVLTEALKVAGIYDATSEGLADLLNATDGEMIPVKNFDVVREKGGVDGLISFIPLKSIIEALNTLYQTRDSIKQEIYEISGVSDVLRGASNPHESATAQELKGEYAGIRLSDRQKLVQNFIKEILSLKAEIIANKFSDETIMRTSSAQQFAITEDGQQIDLSQALGLLKDNFERDYRIEIETNSTIATNQAKTKEEIKDFMEGFMQLIANVSGGIPAPLMPVVKEASLFYIRTFRAGRALETSIEKALDALKSQQEQAAQQPPPPDPMIQAEQIKAQSNQAEMQMKVDADMQNHQGTMALKQEQAYMDFEIAQRKLDIEELQAEIEIERLGLERAKLEAELGNQDKDYELRSAEMLMKDSDRDGIAAMDENKPRTKRKVEGTLPNGVLVTEETEGVGI